MKVGGGRKLCETGGLLGAIVIGALVAILAVGTWAVLGGMDRQGGTSFAGGGWGLHSNPVEDGKRIMHEGVSRIPACGRFTAVGDREANPFRKQSSVLNDRTDSCGVRRASCLENVVGSVGISRDKNAVPADGGRRCSEKRFSQFPSFTTRLSSVSRQTRDARPGGVDEARELSPSTGHGARSAVIARAALPQTLVANQQGQSSTESPGAGAEEPAPLGLVVGLLCVVAIAGALVGRHAGDLAGKRERRE